MLHRLCLRLYYSIGSRQRGPLLNELYGEVLEDESEN